MLPAGQVRIYLACGFTDIWRATAWTARPELVV